MEENKKCKREIVEKNLKLEKDNGCLKEDLKMHSSSNNKIKELQEAIEDLQKQQQENAQSLSRIQEQKMALQKEIKTLCDKNAVQTLWREQQARELEDFDKLKKEAQIRTSDISELKHQNKDLKAKDQQKQNKMRELQNLLQNEGTKSKNVQEAFNNEKLSTHQLSEKAETLPALNNKLQSLQSEKDGLLGELMKSRKQAKSFEKDIEMLKEEIQGPNLKSKELLELLQIKTSVSDNLLRELQSKDVHLASLEEEAVKTCKIIDGMQLELEKLYLEIENDRERNTRVALTLNQGNQCLKKEVKGRKGNEQKLAIQVSTFKNQIKHVEDKLLNVHMYLSKSEKENASLKELNMTLDHEISVIKAELEGNKSKNQSLDD
ncbi:GRIP and coiled-coil domain-containing protein 2-like [Girardinichthys multiradiatus]|uniref:GRIP and coiled-coil domain-containing protein 2-like n=1 Tax=Girardinichthys multiradiatus TaxID=208333 RepID=UPI001FAC7862|nr:GRIP and coiled-coil domain-containing protein 2-like [Girardinichthys multiradiatus]